MSWLLILFILLLFGVVAGAFYWFGCLTTITTLLRALATKIKRQWKEASVAVVGLVLLIVGGGALLLPGGVLDDFPGATPWEISGNTVFINDSRAYLSITPHTLTGDDDVEFTILSKNFTGDLTVAFEFDNDVMTPSNPRRLILSNKTVQYQLTCDTSNGSQFYNASGGVAYCWTNNNTLLWNQSFDSFNLSNETIYWSEQVDNSTFVSVNANPEHVVVGGRKVYYWPNVAVVAGVPRTFKFHLNTAPGSGKYNVSAWPSSYGGDLGQASLDGNYYLLDPWWNNTEGKRIPYWYENSTSVWTHVNLSSSGTTILRITNASGTTYAEDPEDVFLWFDNASTDRMSEYTTALGGKATFDTDHYEWNQRASYHIYPTGITAENVSGRFDWAQDTPGSVDNRQVYVFARMNSDSSAHESGRFLIREGAVGNDVNNIYNPTDGVINSTVIDYLEDGTYYEAEFRIEGDYMELWAKGVFDGNGTTTQTLGSGFVGIGSYVYDGVLGMKNIRFRNFVFDEPNVTAVYTGDNEWTITIDNNVARDLTDYEIRIDNFNLTGNLLVEEIQNHSYQYAINITINSSEVDSDLTDFPVYVNMNAVNFNWSHFNESDCGDLRVTNSAGTELPREVVSCDYSTITNNLVSYYAVDDNLTTTNVIDSTGTYDGTATVNTSTISSTGKLNEAFDLDGATEWFTAPDASGDFGSGDFSLAVWIKKGASDFQDGALFHKYSGKGYYLKTEDATGSLKFFVFADSNLGVDTGTTGVSLTDWSHVVAVRDGTTLRIYVNGDEWVSGPGPTGTVDGTTDLFMGKASHDPSAYYRGLMDELAVFDKALSPAEVRQLYSSSQKSYSNLDDGIGELHFKADFINSSSDTTFTIYYGSPTATDYAVTDTYGRNAVWSDYEQVFHLQEDPSGGAPQMIDSSANSDGTSGGTMTSSDSVPFIILQGLDFEGTNDYVVSSKFLTGGPLTMSGWANIDVHSTWNPLFGASGTSGAVEGTSVLVNANGDIYVYVSDGSTQGSTLFDVNLSINTDYHIGMTWDGTTTANKLIIYVDGVPYAGTSTKNAWSGNSQDEFTFGAYQQINTFYGFLDGTMDEITVLFQELSGDEITAIYSNQKPNSVFLSSGSEVDLNGTAPPANNAPSLTTPTNESVVYNNTDLVWQSTVTDDDGNVTNVTFYHYVDGSNVYNETFLNQANGTQVNSTLAQTYFTTWQNVSVIVGATDGEDDATNVTGWLNVTNREPVAISGLNPSSGLVNTTISFYCYATDADNHTINTSWTVKKNSTNVTSGSTGFVGNATNTTVHTLEAELNYFYTIECTPNDGYEDGTLNSTISSVFTDTAPTATTAITYTALYEGLPIGFYCAVSDADSHPVRLHYSIAKNSTNIANGTTAYYVSGTNVSLFNTTTEENYQYWLNCTPDDSWLNGTLAQTNTTLFSGLPTPAFCSGVSDLVFNANISRGTFYPNNNKYYEVDITPDNQTECAYLLNNTAGFSVTYTSSTNLSQSTLGLYMNGTRFNSTSNYTIAVGAGTAVKLNTTFDILNHTLTVAMQDFTVTWTEAVT